MARRSIQERPAQSQACEKALTLGSSKQERAWDSRRKVLLSASVVHRLKNTRAAAFSMRLCALMRAELPGFITQKGDSRVFDGILISAATKTNNDWEERP